MGNYRGFGDSKFVPNVSKSKLQALVFAESLFEDKKERDFVELLWKECSEKLYTLSKEKLLLGFPPNGVTTYFSANMTEADAIVVKQFLKDNVSFDVLFISISHYSAYFFRILRLTIPAPLKIHPLGNT